MPSLFEHIGKILFQTATLGSLIILFHRHVATLSHSLGPSMSPTFSPNDKNLFLVSKFRKNYQIGDIVVFLDPTSLSINYLCKRIRAMPGDIVVTASGSMTNKTTEINAVPIPKGHVWVEGDNPDLSFDSRVFGPISMNLIVGRLSATVWPPRQWRRINREPNFYERKGSEIYSRVVHVESKSTLEDEIKRKVDI